MINVEIIKVHAGQILPCGWVTGNKELTIGGLIEGWSQNPEDIPKVHWSDVVLYVVSTPSPYTKEAIKVCQLIS